jgi:RimJ/RimL family protein N-acetyltransferase
MSTRTPRPPFALRPAQLGDAAALSRFKRVALAETEFLLQGPEDWPGDVAAERSLIEAFQGHSRSLLLLALEGDNGRSANVVAMCSVVGGPFVRNAHVGQLGMAVLRSHWRSGLGRALLDYTMRWAAGPGNLRKLSLQVHTANTPAHALYVSAGFEHEGVLRGEAMLNDAPADLILMGRFLAEIPEMP